MHKPQSKKQNLRRDALQIFHDALKSVHPGVLIPVSVTREGDILQICDKSYKLSLYQNIYVIGAGKATASMALAVEQILPDVITDGLIVVKYGHTENLQKIRQLEAGHPIPDLNGEKASNAILDLVTQAGQDDLIIFLVSGGGSSLLEIPAGAITVSDSQVVTENLLACGAEITEINTLRKHLSLIKGGWLAVAAAPATVVTLAISDVIGDSPDAIASGPTVPDLTTFSDAWSVIEKYGLKNQLPGSVIDYIAKNLSEVSNETPKMDHPAFKKCHYHLIGSNRILLKTAAEIAGDLGYYAEIVTEELRGEARKCGSDFAQQLKLKGNSSEDQPICLLAGGETTVILSGSGKGGRNQELALAAAIELNDQEDCVVLAAGTDGTDGPTDAAGAIVDAGTLRRAHLAEVNAEACLKNNDSYSFFKQTGDLIVTGPTGTNVMDVVIGLSGKPR